MKVKKEKKEKFILASSLWVLLDDVWDQDSAYMEVLAKEVSYTEF